jgi:hypothetical protein
MNYGTLVQTLPQDGDGVLFDVGSLYARFLTIPDPRHRRGVRYGLALALVATPAHTAGDMTWRHPHA